VDLIQSVDSVRLLEAIDKAAAKQGIVQDILLEINVGQEESKSGFALEEVDEILSRIGNFSAIRVLGFMAIPPICRNSTENHKFFQKMYNLSVDIMQKKYDNVCVNILSMGMSGDFADAIACGSTMIRVGTAIFGARDYS
jgi:pyridoxal phosphate enzyme (YggS family)